MFLRFYTYIWHTSRVRFFVKRAQIPSSIWQLMFFVAHIIEYLKYVNHVQDALPKTRIFDMHVIGAISTTSEHGCKTGGEGGW